MFVVEDSGDRDNSIDVILANNTSFNIQVEEEKKEFWHFLLFLIIFYLNNNIFYFNLLLTQ